MDSYLILPKRELMTGKTSYRSCFEALRIRSPRVRQFELVRLRAGSRRSGRVAPARLGMVRATSTRTALDSKALRLPLLRSLPTPRSPSLVLLPLSLSFPFCLSCRRVGVVVGTLVHVGRIRGIACVKPEGQGCKETLQPDFSLAD